MARNLVLITLLLLPLCWFLHEVALEAHDELINTILLFLWRRVEVREALVQFSELFWVPKTQEFHFCELTHLDRLVDLLRGGNIFYCSALAGEMKIKLSQCFPPDSCRLNGSPIWGTRFFLLQIYSSWIQRGVALSVETTNFPLFELACEHDKCKFKCYLRVM